MKFTANTAQLAKACQNVQRAVASKNSSIPAIEGILLDARGNRLYLTGYDLEVGIKTAIEAQIDEEGAIILNDQLLCDILRRLPGEFVEIEADDRFLTEIRCGETKFSLIGIDAQEYPELPSVTGGEPVLVEQEILRDMVRQTIFATATTESKAIYTGIEFEIENNGLRLVAVDGFRLAIRSEKIDYTGEKLCFVVPSKTLSEVVKLTGEENDPIRIGVGRRHIVFEIDGYSVVSRLLDGEFLNYRESIPSVNNLKVKVNTKLFIDSIERTSLLINDRVKSPIKCIFDAESIRISSTTALGSANDRIDDQCEGTGIEIGFNNKYMLDALKACDVDEVTLLLSGPLNPIIILPPQGESFLYMILPVVLK